jgi:hypothetical protein
LKTTYLFSSSTGEYSSVVPQCPWNISLHSHYPLTSNTASALHIQRISFLPHYLDVDADSSTLRHKPGTKCKGFTFVIFSSLDEAESITTAWTWDHRFSTTSSAPDPATPFPVTTLAFLEAASNSISEARKHGFSKLRWDVLKEEYLAWRQTLLDEAFAAQGTAPPTEYHYESAEYPIEDPIDDFKGDSQNQTELKPLTPVLTLPSPYPPDCLFIRNIHPSTNKTTLRLLFGNVLLTDGMIPQDIECTSVRKGWITVTCAFRPFVRLCARSFLR